MDSESERNVTYANLFIYISKCSVYIMQSWNKPKKKHNNRDSGRNCIWFLNILQNEWESEKLNRIANRISNVTVVQQYQFAD